ncbi:hypothetical protein [Cellulomonas chengniuliangii]|uniref:Protein RecA n=1 Tax=Cellulomonas chengniuliangii TaxID=2968084 RepID=A0ABY5KWB6_9CELL|nr:hypothetical protein [Cellulomonas chengniuliangii]MCC2308667.1 hypothetical protein [Cellulomonas chengniuliangii]UUI74025.1 hypothetical protein NP064_09230 [Cellulomonas chengniuliangii]
MLSREERAARARAALAHAEQRTGARPLVLPGGTVVPRPPGSSAPGLGASGPSASGPGAATEPAQPVPAAAPDASEARGGEARNASLLLSERPSLPVPDELAALLPDGLRRGGITAVTGSTSLLLALLAHACAEGAWAAVVGQPSMGLLAAAQAGVALERLALVPRPGPDAPSVVAALVDGLDVVLVGPGAALADGDRRRLGARARDRGAVLLSSTAWPGANVVLTAASQRWSGAEDGAGRLRAHELRVTRSGRGGAGVPQSLTLTLPLGRPAGGTPPAPGAGKRQAAPTQKAASAPLRLVG